MRVSRRWQQIWAVTGVYAFHTLSRQLIEDMLSAFHSRFRTVLPWVTTATHQIRAHA